MALRAGGRGLCVRSGLVRRRGQWEGRWAWPPSPSAAGRWARLRGSGRGFSTACTLRDRWAGLGRCGRAQRKRTGSIRIRHVHTAHSLPTRLNPGPLWAREREGWDPLRDPQRAGPVAVSSPGLPSLISFSQQHRPACHGRAPEMPPPAAPAPPLHGHGGGQAVPSGPPDAELLQGSWGPLGTAGQALRQQEGQR